MSTQPISAEQLLTTEQFAAALQLNPQTLRKRLSQTGTYFGVQPIKLPNGRLRWPSDPVRQLLGEVSGDAKADQVGPGASQAANPTTHYTPRSGQGGQK